MSPATLRFNGGCLTDAEEREIFRRLLQCTWNAMEATLVVLAIAFRMINSVVFDHRLIRGSEFGVRGPPGRRRLKTERFSMSRLYLPVVYIEPGLSVDERGTILAAAHWRGAA